MKKITALILALLLLLNVCSAAAESAGSDLLAQRRLSDQEIAALDSCTADEVRAAISTLGMHGRTSTGAIQNSGTMRVRAFIRRICAYSIILQATF